jgi:hypothetical protein
MYSKKEDFSLGNAVSKMLDESRWGKRYMAIGIQEDWKEIMGDTIAKYTKSLSLENAKLIIQTDIAPLKNELSLNKKSIIEKINAFYKKDVVTEVIIS